MYVTVFLKLLWKHGNACVSGKMYPELNNWK